jgi:hypothetical protein
MQPDLHTLPIESVTYAHLEAMIGVEEGVRLEFKQELSTSDGAPDRWMRDQTRIGRVARDNIASEVVAFANAYGGVLIVGMEETDDNPKRAKAVKQPLIPKVRDCAEQLEQALGSVIDPPLAMLEVRGLVHSDDAGLLLVRVGASPSAPHGVGKPPLAYVRRGAASEPLTMRDMQSMFFERRSRLERIEALRGGHAGSSAQLIDAWCRNAVARFDNGSVFAENGSGLFFRCSLYAVEDMAIANLPDRLAASGEIPRPRIVEHGELVRLPTHFSEWRRGYRALRYSDNIGDSLYWKVVLTADGSFEQNSIQSTNPPNPAVFIPHYGAVVLQGMIVCEWIRRWAARPDVEYVLDGQFHARGSVSAHPGGNYRSPRAIPWGAVELGPYSIGPRASFPDTYDMIERELWDLFGLKRQDPLKFDLDAVFRSTGL